MIVFDLQCELKHTFEGWFGSSDDFESQLQRGLVTCPMCDNGKIIKRLSAPRINLGAGVPPLKKVPDHTLDKSGEMLQGVTSALSDEGRLAVEKMQAAWAEVAQKVIANTEDVGSSFAEEARKIHYKEAPERNIRGIASTDDAMALREEGIEVHAFPLPAALKGSLQ
jgi:hypothetical protein